MDGSELKTHTDGGEAIITLTASQSCHICALIASISSAALPRGPIVTPSTCWSVIRALLSFLRSLWCGGAGNSRRTLGGGRGKEVSFLSEAAESAVTSDCLCLI